MTRNYARLKRDDLAPDVDDEGTYTWVTKSGATESGSEDEMFAAIQRGDMPDVTYDASTGLYRWVQTK
jgi:hypothetical protein